MMAIRFLLAASATTSVLYADQPHCCDDSPHLESRSHMNNPKHRLLLIATAMLTVATLALAQPMAEDLRPAFADDFPHPLMVGEGTGLDGIITNRALRMTVQEGAGRWPGVPLKNPGGGWDLSAYSGVSVAVKNAGASSVRFGLRIDSSAGEDKLESNTELVRLAPGEDTVLQVTFGKSWGNTGHDIDRANVTGMVAFLEDPEPDAIIEISTLRAFTGEPVEAGSLPLAIATGKTLALNPKLDGLDAHVSASAQGMRSALLTVLPDGGRWPGMGLVPPYGSMDLSKYAGIKAILRNTGAEKIRVAMRVDNPGADGRNHCNTETATIPPGEEREIKVTFGQSWGNPGAQLDTKGISNILVFFDGAKSGARVEVCELSTWGEGPRREEPREVTAFDFETDDEPYSLKDGKLTRDKGLVVAGAGSLYGNSSNQPREWFEYFFSVPGLMAGGYEYELTYRYHVISADKDAYAYSLFRSASAGWGPLDRGWTNVKDLARKEGTTDTQTCTVKIGDVDDYQLMFGIHGEAAIAIDDVRITRGKAYQEPSEEERLLKRVPEDAEIAWTLGFEAGEETMWKPASGTLVQEGALAGEQSLAIDSIDGSGEWRNVASIGPGMFPTGYTYHVFVYAKTEARRTGGSKWFITARSGKGQRETDLGWRNVQATPGKTRVLYATFTPRDFADYGVLVGTQNGIKGILDRVTVRRIPARPVLIGKRKPLDTAQAKLVFEENFDGELSPDKWKIFNNHARRGGYWMAECAYPEAGNLVLKFDRNKKGKFVMGCIETSDRFLFTYGYVEARMQCPKEVGHWPGIWLFGPTVGQVGNDGRDGTEVDIVECPWRKKDEVSHALHWDGYNEDHQSEGHHVAIPGINEGFHTYAVDWSEDGYIFFIDGKETWRTDAGGGCTNELYLMLSDEMGGWSGDPGKAENLPDKTLIDYIRVWQ